MAKRSEAKNAKLSFASKKELKYFDAKLCFALFVSLRSAIFNQIYVDNKIFILPARVKFITFYFRERKRHALSAEQCTDLETSDLSTSIPNSKIKTRLKLIYYIFCKELNNKNTSINN